MNRNPDHINRQCRFHEADLRIGMNSTLIRAASVMIIAALTIVALAYAQTVFIPMAFALFAIAILWPLQRALQKKIPSGLALVVTILLALVIVVKLISVVAWGGGQIGQWFIDNFDRLNLLYAETIFLCRRSSPTGST
jgi:predicted PurR-regulated permease PerM